ncbi:MAG: CRISPR-associated protein Cas4 [Candidatus Helarchaeota archaeon]
MDKVDITGINGTLIWYYYICPREVWYMSHKIIPDQMNNFIETGREIDKYYYRRDKKRILLDNQIQIDIIRKNKVIAEVKKSTKSEKSAYMQLAFYLFYLKNIKGTLFNGILLFPLEKRKIEVRLTKELEKELVAVIEEVKKIIGLEKPPKPIKNKYCIKCGYNEFCWV